MVRSVSALAAAVVAMTVASGMAQSYNDYYGYEAREFFDELDARDYNDFDAREYFSELHAREYFSGLSEYEARSAYDLDAREYDAVLQYIRDTTPPPTHYGHHFGAYAAVPAATPVVPTLHTVTVTSTHVPTATACSKHELNEQAKAAATKKAEEHKTFVAQRKQRKEDEKRKKAAEKEAKHEAWVHRHDKNWKPTPTTTSLATGATNNSTVPAVAAGVHAAQAPLITPPPVLVAGPNVTISTVTAQGTVTVQVTTTAPVPTCTKASRFHNIFKHHRRSDEDVGTLFAREYDFDDLD